MASTERVTAVENPMQKSVPKTSLSMVLGIATTWKPSWCMRQAKLSVSSPPIGMIASISRASSTLRMWRVQSTVPLVVGTLSSCLIKSGTWSGAILLGFVRDVWRTVPPVLSMVRTFSTVRSIVDRDIVEGSSGLIDKRPSHPRRMPIMRISWLSACETTALMATLRPGTSPPPVSIPTFRFPATCPSGIRYRSLSLLEYAEGHFLSSLS